MKIKLLYLIFLLTSSIVTCQVGINTTSPHPSSIFEVYSTSQGILTPRLTSVERNSIVNPAHGLLVFDTDENSFFFFNNSVWIPIKNGEFRNHHKIIKSASDLTNELVAGGGTKYLLTSNYMYEINGAISLNYPIELNGAYLKGNDNFEDQLINYSGEPLFIGSTGGSIKKLSVYGNNLPIFNIEGSGSETLVSTSVNYIQSSTLGNIKNMKLVFFNISQFIGNANGLLSSNNASFFMTLFNWVENNSGTFLTLTGTYQEIQLSNSKVVINPGEVGIDVSSNPTVLGSGTISHVSFDGEGDFVNGYTLNSYNDFSFTNNWFVQCKGLVQESDGVATGSVYVNNPVSTNILAANTPIKVSGSTTPFGMFRTTSTIDNRITYLGSKDRYFKYSAAITITAQSNNKNFNFYIAKNGVIVPGSKQCRRIGSGADMGSITISGLVRLKKNDYVEVWVENTDDNSDITAQAMNFLIN